ncbi:hypothetical protein V6N13_084066 [Hibiscus sabdariffa]
MGNLYRNASRLDTRIRYLKLRVQSGCTSAIQVLQDPTAASSLLSLVRAIAGLCRRHRDKFGPRMPDHRIFIIIILKKGVFRSVSLLAATEVFSWLPLLQKPLVSYVGGRQNCAVIVKATGDSSESSTSLSILKSVRNVWDNSDEDKVGLVGLGFAAIVALWTSTNVISAVDKLPIIPVVFEIIGILFSTWFVYRYLLFKPDREELYQIINKTISQIFGQKRRRTATQKGRRKKQKVDQRPHFFPLLSSIHQPSLSLYKPNSFSFFFSESRAFTIRVSNVLESVDLSFQIELF